MRWAVCNLSVLRSLLTLTVKHQCAHHPPAFILRMIQLFSLSSFGSFPPTFYFFALKKYCLISSLSFLQNDRYSIFCLLILISMQFWMFIKETHPWEVLGNHFTNASVMERTEVLGTLWIHGFWSSFATVRLRTSYLVQSILFHI